MIKRILKPINSLPRDSPPRKIINFNTQPFFVVKKLNRNHNWAKKIKCNEIFCSFRFSYINASAFQFRIFQSNRHLKLIVFFFFPLMNGLTFPKAMCNDSTRIGLQWPGTGRILTWTRWRIARIVQFCSVYSDRPLQRVIYVSRVCLCLSPSLSLSHRIPLVQIFSGTLNIARCLWCGRKREDFPQGCVCDETSATIAVLWSAKWNRNSLRTNINESRYACTFCIFRGSKNRIKLRKMIGMDGRLVRKKYCWNLLSISISPT